MKDYSWVKSIEIEIDDDIVLPDWVNIRIRQRLYNNLLIRFGITNGENIHNYCKAVAASIYPLYSESKVIYSEKRKGNILQLRFGTESKNGTAQQQKY